MLKKIFITSLILFTLVWCWEDSLWVSTGLKTTNTEDITIDLPSNWKIIKEKDDILPKVKNWKIELAVMSEKLINWFSNNILILSDDLSKTTTSKEFSMLNNIWAQSDYLDYTNLGSKEIKFADEDVSMLYIFEAKYNLDTPKLKFIQTAHICNMNKAYFLTLAIPTTVKDTTKYEYLLSTFKCK